MGVAKQMMMEQMEANAIAEDLKYLGDRYGYEEEWKHGKCPSRQNCEWCAETVEKDEDAYFVGDRLAEVACHRNCVEDAYGFDHAMDKND